MPGQDISAFPLVSYRDKVTVDHESDVPPYLQLAAILRGRILSGEIAARRPLPSVTALQQEHGLARGTIRKAVAVLADEGLVVIRPGWGTFVVPQDQRK